MLKLIVSGDFHKNVLFSDMMMRFQLFMINLGFRDMKRKLYIECSRFHSLQLLNYQAIFLLSSPKPPMSLNSISTFWKAQATSQQNERTYFLLLKKNKIKMKVLQLINCSLLCQLRFRDSDTLHSTLKSGATSHWLSSGSFITFPCRLQFTTKISLLLR